MWGIERTPKFTRSYAKLSSDAQQRCNGVISELAGSDDPRLLGDRLVGEDAYKYRFGDYRLIYAVGIRVRLIELLNVGKRSRVYD